LRWPSTPARSTASRSRKRPRARAAGSPLVSSPCHTPFPRSR
jgi:hypothetical protein